LNDPESPRTIKLFKKQPVGPAQSQQTLPIKILHPNHTEVVGTGYVLLTTPHTTVPVELYPGTIVEDVALSSRACAVIGKNNPASNEERIHAARQEITERTSEIVKENGIKCVLEINSKTEPGLDILTNQGKTCSQETANLILTLLSKSFHVTIDQQPQTHETKGSSAPTRNLDPQYVSVSIGSDELAMSRDKLVDQLTELVGLLNVRLGFDPARQPTPED